MALFAPWLADFQLLAAALLLGVMLAIAVLRQPAQRLAVAKSTLAALAALAILCAVPGWSLVHLLSDEEATDEPTVSRIEPAPAFSSTLTTLAPTPDLFEVQPPESPAGAMLHLGPSREVGRVTAISWTIYLATAYAAGSAAVTLWLIVGAILAYRVRREATPAPRELQQLLQELCGPEKPTPQLLISPRITAPVALGLRRPAILLPPPSQGGARGGIRDVSMPIDSESRSPLPPSTLPIQHSPFLISSPQLLPILTHELAHIEHRDLHTLAATRLLLILLWPQPLFWLLRRTIRLDQETLADAAAADRAGRLDYAQQLLAWARTAGTQRPPRLAGAVGLWEGPSQLKRRIALLLNEQFDVMRSCSVAWRRLCIASLAVAAVTLSFVTLQPSPVVGEDATTVSGGNTAEASTPATTPATTSPVSEGSTTISGNIVTEDGSPATVTGRLYSNSINSRGSSMSGGGRFTSAFSTEVRNGTVWLYYFPEGFAPAWVGPLQANGRDLTGVTLVLKPGATVPIEVTEEAGTPVAGANTAALPIIVDGSRHGPVFERLTDEKGRYQFQHVAAKPYAIEVTAPKFEPLRFDSIEMQADQPLKLTLKRAQPTTGVIENEDGTSAAGALLRFRAEVRQGHTNSGASPYGSVVATADAQGRFTLDSLATGSSCLYIAETIDGARAWSPEITAGMSDVVIRVPARRDLRARVIGDVDKLPKRNGKPFISVQQRHEFKSQRGNYGDLVGDDAFITPTAEGGEFAYEGLLPGEVELSAGEFKTTVAVNEQGVTEVVLQVTPKEAVAKPASETRHQAMGQAAIVAVPLTLQEPSTKNANKLSIAVVDEQGAPLPGVEALIYSVSSPQGEHVLDRTVATDADGKFVADNLVPSAEVERFKKLKAEGGFIYDGSKGGYVIVLRRAGLATALLFQSPGDLALYGANRTIKMRPAVKLSGQVTDPAGRPVASAKVIAGDSFVGCFAIDGVNAVTTDAEGRYEFADRAAFNRAESSKQQNQFFAGSLRFHASPAATDPAAAEDPSTSGVSNLLVSHPDYAVTRVEGGDVPGVADVQLLPAASISGRVVQHGSGDPAAGVTVHAAGFPDVSQDAPNEMRIRSAHSAVTTTDATGAYRFSNLPAARYDVWADAGAQEMRDAPWVSRGQSRIEALPGGEATKVPDLIIGPSAMVQVQLVDAESGKPVELPAGATANLAPQRVDGPSMQQTPLQRVSTTTDGKFDMRLFPGRSRVLLFIHEGAVGSPAIWQTDDDVDSTGEVFDLQPGEMISATINVLPVARINELRERDMAANKLMEESKFAEAIAACTSLIADFPQSHFRVLQRRGHAYNRLGDYAAALADFEASLKLAPDNTGTKYFIASLLATTPVDADRDSRRALEYAEQLAALARKQDDSQHWLASILDIKAAAYADLGEFDKAIKIEEEAIKLTHESLRDAMKSRLELYQSNQPFRRELPLTQEAVK